MLKLFRFGTSAGRRTGRAILLALCYALAPLGFPLSAAEKETAPEVSEYAIKAACLYNFLLFTDWPEQTFETKETAIRVAVAGFDPFGSLLEAAMKDKQVRGHAIEIVRVKEGQPVPKCHLLFCSAKERKAVEKLLGGQKGRPVLTVGEAADFCEWGGIAQVYLDHGKLRFAFNIGAVGESGLKIDPKLLRLAKVVNVRGK